MEDFRNAFAAGVAQASTSNASAVIQMNQDNEMGTTQKPPKLMAIDEFEGWKDKFVNWIQANQFDSWVAVEDGYVWPLDERDQELPMNKFSAVDKAKYVAEKKMISLIQQSVKEDILILLPETETSQELWQALCDKFKGSDEMIKSKKALIKKEFEIFTMIKGETMKQMIDRYCHLMVQMRRHDIKRSTEEQIEKLADALPKGEWTTYLTILKNSPSWRHFKLSSFIDKLEGHEMELMKIAKSKNANIVQDVGIYYKGGSQDTPIQGPKIQTAFSANANASPSQSSPYAGYPSSTSSSSFQSHTSQSSSDSNVFQCNIAVDLKNVFPEKVAKQHIALLATVLESYEGLVAGKIGNPKMIAEDYDQVDEEELELMDIKWSLASIIRRVTKFINLGL